MGKYNDTMVEKLVNHLVCDGYCPKDFRINTECIDPEDLNLCIECWLNILGEESNG